MGEEFIEPTELQQDLLDFLEIDNRFQGWLLTLSETEFEELVDKANSEFDDELSIIAAITLLGRMPIKGDKIDEDDYIISVTECISDILYISLYKKGLVDIDKEDDEWKFKINDNGKQKI